MPRTVTVAMAVAVAVTAPVVDVVVDVHAVAVASAQEIDAGPADEPRYRVVRPAEGSLRRGSLAVPAWLPIASGVAVGAAATFLLIRRARRSRK